MTSLLDWRLDDNVPAFRLSVLIDTYNHENFVEGAILSVLEQDFPQDEMEIIVVDDGSTDHTPEIVRKFAPKVRLIRKENGGQGSAFNLGIAATSGDIVAFLDGDDWWTNQKLSSISNAFLKNPDVAAVGHGYYEVPEGHSPSEMVVASETCHIDLSSRENAKVANLGRTLLGTSRLSVRRHVLERIGQIPEAFVFCADAPILTLSLALGGAIILDQTLCYYRLHQGSLFTHSSPDAAKSLRKAEMLAITVEYLRPRLKEFGVPDEIASIALEAYQLEIDRLRLNSGAGGRWQSMAVELRDFRASYREASIKYVLFKAAVIALAGVLPPERFYAIREWYSRKNWQRFRGKWATAESNAALAPFRRSPIQRQS